MTGFDMTKALEALDVARRAFGAIDGIAGTAGERMAEALALIAKISQAGSAAVKGDVTPDDAHRELSRLMSDVRQGDAEADADLDVKFPSKR